MGAGLAGGQGGGIDQIRSGVRTRPAAEAALAGVAQLAGAGGLAVQRVDARHAALVGVAAVLRQDAPDLADLGDAPRQAHALGALERGAGRRLVHAAGGDQRIGHAVAAAGAGGEAILQHAGDRPGGQAVGAADELLAAGGQGPRIARPAARPGAARRGIALVAFILPGAGAGVADLAAGDGHEERGEGARGEDERGEAGEGGAHVAMGFKARTSRPGPRFPALVARVGDRFRTA